MSRLLVKQLQLAGVGIIRSDLIKKTIGGKIYEAKLYYKDQVAEVIILYKRNGKGIVLGPKFTTEKDLEDFKNLMLQVIPSIPRPDYRIMRNIRMAILAAIAITTFNIATAPLTIIALVIHMANIAITTGLILLYRREKEIYVRDSK